MDLSKNLGWRIQDGGSFENEILLQIHITPSKSHRRSLVMELIGEEISSIARRF